MSSPHFDKNPLESAQRAALNLHSVPRSQKRPRLMGKPGRNYSPDGIDLGFVHWYRPALVANDLNDTWSHEDGESMLNIQTAKQITGKQRGVDNLDSVRPEPSALVKRNQRIVSSAA